MKYLTILLLFLCGCSFTPDNRSVFIVYSKSLVDNSLLGKYKYRVTTSFTNHNYIDYYSNENYELGDTLKICNK